MPTLFEIGQEGAELEALLTEMDGELTPELEARFDAFLAGGKAKLDAAARVMQNLLLAADACDTEAKRLDERANSFRRQVAALKARMMFAVDQGFGGKVKTDTHTFWTQTSAEVTTCELAPDTDLKQFAQQHPEFVRVTYDLNREALKHCLKAGFSIGPEITVTTRPGTRFLRVK